MTDRRETLLRFLVPASTSAALAAEVARADAVGERASLVVLHLDSQGGHLGRAGIGWCLRREGRRWIQSLTQQGRHAHEQLEHAVIRPDATWDAGAHAGSAILPGLQKALRSAESVGDRIDVCCRVELRRSTRRVRGRAATVDITLDDGRLMTETARLPVRELSFGLVSGSAFAVAAMAERWRKRFELICEPRLTSERGGLLCRGITVPPLCKAQPLQYGLDASAQTALGTVLDDCLSQMTRNALGLCQGDPALRAEHVHQLRVGIRRLRSALRSFDAWVPAPPAALLDALRTLFAQLGQARDHDVMASGVAIELAAAGAPALTPMAAAANVDPVALVGSAAAQRLFLGWIGWRLALLDVLPTEAGGRLAPPDDAAQVPAAEAAEPAVSTPAQAVPAAPACPPDAFPRMAAARLGKWHRRIMADGQRFDLLDETAMHDLRKRIKRQRYAVEFFAPLLRRREVAHYLKTLARVQEHMGRLNDLFVARASYEAQIDAQPAAWFALGWLTARIAELRAAAQPDLLRLAHATAPRHRRKG